MKFIINIQKKYAAHILILFAVLAIEVAINYASAVPLQWHPLSEFSFDIDGNIGITMPSGEFNSTYIDGPINVSSSGNVGIGVAPSNKRLTVSGNISIGAGNGIIFPDGTFLNSCWVDIDGDGRANNKCNGQITDYCDNNITAWLINTTDVDGDNHSPIQTCPGGPWPKDDCNDACATCYPGSTAYTCAADGLDQDCNGVTDDWVYGGWAGIGGSCGALGQSCKDWITNNNLLSGCVVQQAVKCTDTWGTQCNFNIGYGTGVGRCIAENSAPNQYGIIWDWSWAGFRPTRCQPYTNYPCASGCSGYGYTYGRFAGMR
ncbi:MAG: hypothetical protein ABIF85_04900 [Nanoarchaeota archaeon]|nr:hypothetical protein [Nanoarchaeota archaeon]MBU4299905.1 hypothetical protein [Nanoarchaeota archaeon]MBU4452224.1 hypothetical protein [Nanoarchaeota archaeon]MCG2724560.1 hypothetical protein [archaeon]